MLGEDAAVGKLREAIGPNYSEKPTSLERFGACRGDLADGHDQQGFKAGIKDPDALRAHKEPDRGGGSASPLIASAVDDRQGAELAGLFISAGIGFGRREKNGGDEHGQAHNREKIAVPQTDRQDDQRRSGESQEKTEERPGVLIASQMQDPGNKQHQREKGPDKGVAES